MNNQTLVHDGSDFYLVDRDGDSRKIPVKAAAKFRHLANDNAQEILDRILVKRFDAPTTPLPPYLDDHQVEGINWALTRSRSYLAHAPGAGKTCEAITAACMTKGFGKTLFIVPPSLTENWVREIYKWTEWFGNWPTISVVPVTAQKGAMALRSDFIVCPDSMLSKEWVQVFLQSLSFKFIAVDEASRFKECKSERTVALFGGQHRHDFYPGLIYEARHVVLLDGSPMPNRPIELWAPTFAMAPETIDFMSMHEFGLKYCGGVFVDDGYKSQWEYRHSANEEELKKKLQKSFMHVVGEERLDHPERRRNIIYMPHSSSSRKLGAGNSDVSDFADEGISESKSLGDLAKKRSDIGLAKVKFIARYVADRLNDQSGSLIVFVWHREVAQALMKLLSKFKPGLVIGGTPSDTREKIFEEFQAGRGRLIIGNISAMGRGHNLQRAKRVIFGEYSWTDELNKQCEKRASRKGSNHATIPCDYIVMPNTIDERVLTAVFTGAKRVKKVIG